MIRLTLGGKPVLDPVEEARNLAQHGKPVPADFARTNSLMNPLGREAARGWLLMLRRDVEAIGVNGLHTLTLEDGERTTSAVGLVISKEPLNLTPSVTANAPDSCCLVEVADARWRCSNPYYAIPVNKQYNVRAPAYGGAAGVSIYHADSLNAGVAWTWQTLVSNLWGLMSGQLGAPPSLPFTPNGTPEGWIWVGGKAWDALCDVLDRIGCAVTWNPPAGAYSIVQVGVADPATDALLLAADRQHRKIHDGEYLPVIRGRIPYGVRVFFSRREQYGGTEETLTRATGLQWQLLAGPSVDVVGPYADSAEPGTYHPLWDDLPAIYASDGTLTNGAALTARATERSADHFRTTYAGGNRLHKTYSGLLLLSPGSLVKGVAWRQQQAAGDVVTEVIRHPFKSVKITDSGEWAECCTSSVPTQPPSFAPGLPVYPLVEQTLQVVDGTITGSGLYDCILLKSDGVGGWSSKEAVWGLDLAGSAALTADERHNCRLIGYVDGRPLLSFRSCSGGVTPVCPPPNATVTYGGVTLPPVTSAWIAFVASNVKPEDVYEFGKFSPGPFRSQVGLPSDVPLPPIRLGSLYWPQGAARWAVAHFLATDTELATIRPLAYAGAALVPLNLVITDGVTAASRTTSLYMLPPRPLDGTTGTWLLTLVDERYFWPQTPLLPDPTATLTDGTLLGLNPSWTETITTDSIDSAYAIGAHVTVQYDRTPPVIDCVCESIGHRFVRHLDGSLETQAADTAATAQDAQLTANAGITKVSGGEFSLTSAADNDLAALTPAEVTVVFPNTGTTGFPQTPTIVTTTLAAAIAARPSLGATFAGLTGYTPGALIQSSAQQNILTDVSALALAIAADFYAWLPSRPDVHYSGIVEWEPGGMDDVVEWRVLACDVSTHVLRPPWNPQATPLVNVAATGTGLAGPLPVQASLWFPQRQYFHEIHIKGLTSSDLTPAPQSSWLKYTGAGGNNIGELDSSKPGGHLIFFSNGASTANLLGSGNLNVPGGPGGVNIPVNGGWAMIGDENGWYYLGNTLDVLGDPVDIDFDPTPTEVDGVFKIIFVGFDGAPCIVTQDELGVARVPLVPVPDFIGDSGTGGKHGLVPAPSAGDCAAGKWLSACGGWGLIPVFVGSNGLDGAAGLVPKPLAGYWAEHRFVAANGGWEVAVVGSGTTNQLTKWGVDGTSILDSCVVDLSDGSTIAGITVNGFGEQCGFYSLATGPFFITTGDAGGSLKVGTTEDVCICDEAGALGFFNDDGSNSLGQQTVTGDMFGNTALASLIEKLAGDGSGYNLIIDDTTDSGYGAYAPGVAGDWNGAAPTTFMTALNRCAALLKVLNGGTGP